MADQDIFATDGFLTLLHNNKPKKIGEVKNGKYYLPTLRMDVECILVTFDFDQDGNEDLFFFNTDHLVFHILSVNSYKNRNWLFNLIESGKTFTQSDLINQVVEMYTAKEMGF